MKTKEIAVFLFNGFSDWELAYLTPEINKSENCTLHYFSEDGQAVLSMGGLQVVPDTSLENVFSQHIDLLVLPGGEAWEKGENTAINHLTKKVYNSGNTVAAICAATTRLGQLGLLNTIKHTSNDLGYLKAIAPAYLGEAHYQNTFAVSDKNIITANGVAPIEFAKAIFEKIELYDSATSEKWFQLFKNGIWEE